MDNCVPALGQNWSCLFRRACRLFWGNVWNSFAALMFGLCVFIFARAPGASAGGVVDPGSPRGRNPHETTATRPCLRVTAGNMAFRLPSICLVIDVRPTPRDAGKLYLSRNCSRPRPFQCLRDNLSATR